MKKIAAVIIAFGFATLVHAQSTDNDQFLDRYAKGVQEDAAKKKKSAAPANDPLTPADYAYVKTLDRTLDTFSPQVLTVHNRAALHRLIGSAPGGKKNDAVGLFLDEITLRVDGDELDSVEKQAAFKTRLGTYLTQADREWMASQKLTVPDPLTMKEWIWTANELKGLHWIVNHDCKPGPMKLGGVDITCKGSKLDDVRAYIGTVNTTIYYVMTHDGG